RGPIGWNARPMTCTVSGLRDIRTCGAFTCTKNSSDIRSERITPNTANSRFRNMSDPEQKNPVAPINGNAREMEELHTPPMRLQFGPSHPATHGTVKITLDLEGEQVVWSEVEVGYLHRGFEKECETGYYYQNIPYTDRLNYSSPILNNVGYCLAVEKLFGIETPPRCNFMRVVGGEASRMMDHMLSVGSSAMELAAFT